MLNKCYFFLIIIIALYFSGYAIARRWHYLVNYNGHQEKFEVTMFHSSGPIPAETLKVGCLCYILFYPLHRLETMFRHDLYMAI